MYPGLQVGLEHHRSHQLKLQGESACPGTREAAPLVISNALTGFARHCVVGQHTTPRPTQFAGLILLRLQPASTRTSRGRWNH
jgi:hypothetical protein